MTFELRATLFCCVLLWSLITPAFDLVGQTPITTINTNAVTTGLTTNTYVATSPSDASGSITPSTSYTINFGQVQNLIPTSYIAGGITYDRFVTPDTLIIRRTDAGRQLIIFYEYDNVDNGTNVITMDPEQQTNEEALYQSGLLNAGYDNILVNTATNFANVERIDIIYNTGIVTSSPSTAVFPIVDRGGNDDIRVAAISSLDANGDPSGYYPTVVQVNNNGTSEWGNSGISHLSMVMRRQDAGSNPLPQATLGSQNIHGSAISFTDFGITANQIVYGYSIFGDDVTATGTDLVDFTNSTNYPTNTGSASGLDLVAGISTAVASDDNLTRSTGPGGYKADLDTWLKANVAAGITTSTDGSTVTDWQDQWLGDHDATTLTSAPTYRDGSASTTDDINFNPTVDFLDATERGLLIANNTDFNTATSYTTKSINIAFRTGNDITTVKQQIYEQGSNDRGINAYIRNGALYVGSWNIPNTDGTGDNWGFSATNTAPSAIATETEYILTIEFDGNTSTTGTVTAYLNGQSFGTISGVGLLFADTDGIGLGDVNGQSRYDDGTTGAASFYGSIPEFIYCNSLSAFSSAQRNRIETYLAVKYGITLDQTTPINYVNSSGSTIFNTTDNAAIGGYLEYNNDIAGIGRDDNSEFDQIQSQSENTGSIVGMAANLAIGIDDTWLLWGNDGGASTASRVVSKPESINERLERIWRAAETNSIGPTDISFDLTGLGLGTTASDFSILIANNSSGADFSSATVVSGGTFNGDVITFPGVNLSNGEYFTLGTQFFICTPGNVQDGLALWLKADAETYNTGTTLATNGQTVETWGDQGRNNFDAANDGGVTNRAPTWVENDVNFNPGINWNAGTNTIGFTLGSNFIFAPAAGGGAHIFSSVQPESSLTGGDRNNKWVVNFGNNNASAYGIATYADRANIVADGKVNFNISPTAGNFLIEGDFNTNAGTADVKNFIIDGESVSSNTGTDIDIDDSGITQAATHASNQGPVSIGRQSETNGLDNNNGRRFFGDMQEVIIYNEDISALQAQQVRSYLAIKYGNTLTNDNDNNAVINEVLGGSVLEGDYVASDGTTITWDYSDDTGFVSNVAGIGRDDDTCLNQKQSSSVNSDAILAIGLGGIETTNADNLNTFDTDLDFLTWATDDASTAFANRTTSGTPGTVTERMLRVWRAQETGTVGATDISFDLTGLGYSSNAGDFQLITANGGDNTSLESGSTLTGGTFNGSVLTFSGVDLTDGQYFTLGVASSLCAPGGVTSSMVMWLRPDAGTSTLIDNSTLSTWTDQSTAGNDATTDGNPPLYKRNTTDNINFQATMEFDGTDDRLTTGDLSEIKSTTGTGRYTVFGIGLRRDATSNYILGSTGNNSNQDLHFGYRNSTAATIAHWGNDLDVTVAAFDSPAQTPYLLSAEYDGSGRIIEELRDDSFARNTDSNTTDVSGTQTNYIGDLASVANYNGFISEVLVYNAAITDLEKLRIYSYFGIKYGITLPQDNDNDLTTGEVISGSVAEGDLVASDGTTIIWDESNGYSTYHNGMAGIGRDDNACLNQKQSTSATNGTILSAGLGTIAADNASNLNALGDLDFLVWGHDNGATAQASANTVDVPSTVSERMTRVWRVEDTGAVGATELQFDLTSLGYSVADASAFTLLISGSPTMASASITTGGTLNGSVLSFSGVDLTDGQYFTIGTALTTCGPGGVNTNIALWLRADQEVFSDAGMTAATNGSDVLQWNDQSSPATNASVTNGGGGAVVEPVYQTNEINFNPTNFISDQNTTNNSFFETAAATNTVSGDMTLIAVFETAQNQGTNDQINNTPSLIGADVTSGTNDYGLGLYQGELVFNAANNSSFTARSSTTYRDGEPYIGTGTRVQAGSGAVNLYVNSLNVGTGTSDATALSGPGTWAVGNQSDYDNEAQLQANVSEVLVFSSVLTGEEQARVESYLALKYGVTRSNNTDGDGTTNEVISGVIREGDYVAADGGIVWDYAARGATYFHDIAGIGRDDLSCFDQVHSKSENDDALVDIQIDSFAADDSWFVWGNDNAAIESPSNPERPASINSRLNREWQAQETGTVGTVSVTFDLADVTGTPTGDNNLNLVRMMVDADGDFNSGVTLVSPTSIDAVNKTVTFDYDFNGSEGFYYTLGSTEDDALPITLLSFETRVDQRGHVVVDWATAQEVNNSFFTLERSPDGENFGEVARLNAAGNSEAVNTYRYIDQNPLKGQSFYRLKQTDFNGEFEYSELRRVEINTQPEVLSFKVFPNPVHNGQTLIIAPSSPDSQNLSYQLFLPNGQQVSYGTYAMAPQQILIDTKRLKPGIYLLRLKSGRGQSITQRVIIR